MAGYSRRYGGVICSKVHVWWFWFLEELRVDPYTYMYIGVCMYIGQSVCFSV